MSDLQHPDARSFEDVAALYERVRPTYPDEAVEWLCEQLGIDRSSTIVDLGAGTGKLTRSLVERAGRVIAVEPGSEMLAQLREAVPVAEAMLGAAEAIPLEDDAVDAIVCGQSFHWFRTDEALAEIRRVLRPGGGLGLIWNMRDPDDPLQEEVTALLDPFVPAGRPPLRASVDAFVRRTFADVKNLRVPFAQQLDAEGVVDRIFSISFVVAAPEAKRRRLGDSLRALVAERGGRISFRYVTEAFVLLNVA